MGQAKLRGTRDERVNASLEAKRELDILAESRRKERQRLDSIREDEQEAARLSDKPRTITGNTDFPPLSSYRHRSLGSSALIAAALGMMLPRPEARRLDTKNMPKDLEEFDRWLKK